MSVDEYRKRERAHLLRKRREKVMPVDVGLPGGLRRRTPGLRREEVAVLAGVSPTWYTYLEQARDVSPSPEVLDNLATVLGLTAYERKYLHNLSREIPSAEPETGRCIEFRAPLQELTASLDPIPAYICANSGDLLSWNRAAAEWLADFEYVPENRRNILVWMLTAETARERFVDWEARSQHLVARFRAEVANSQDSPRVTQLIKELSAESPLFRRWWDEHIVAGPDSTAYLMRRPHYGVVPVRTVELLYREVSGCAKMVLHMPTGDLARITVPHELPGTFRKDWSGVR
ncbi:helix-turn-helix transcriptional regulator [Streptomyces sp. NPDC004647]|uniref:helix-turn-helix transcriptional regulator n=1 Tax=Streptomyces sp. NPDC004647 TaxID=3154671 RepID=UPI00339EC53B